MKTQMVELMSLIKYGDMTKLAHDAKISPSTLSNIINGKTNIEAYPQLPKILGDYVVRRAIELQGEFDLLAATKETCKKLGVVPLTDEEVLKKKLTYFRINRMSPGKLLEVNEKLNLRLKIQRNEEWGSGDWEDFALAICDKLGLKEIRRR